MNAVATKPTPASKRSASPAVQAVPDLAALEQFVNDAMAAQQSAMCPDDLAKQKFVADLRGIEREIAANDDEIALIQRIATSLMQVRMDRKERLERAASRYRNALLDGAEHQEGQST